MYAYLDKLAFVAHPRMASRSISDALMRSGADKVGEHHDVDFDRIELIERNHGTVFCVKRNMFDVLVSWYYRSKPSTFADDYVETQVPLEDFTEWLGVILAGGHQYLDVPLYHYGLDICNRVLRFEGDLQFRVFMEMVHGDIHPQDIEHRGKSHRLGYMDYYTPKTRKLVESRWAEDLELTDYKFGD